MYLVLEKNGINSSVVRFCRTLANTGDKNMLEIRTKWLLTPPRSKVELFQTKFPH